MSFDPSNQVPGTPPKPTSAKKREAENIEQLSPFSPNIATPSPATLQNIWHSNSKHQRHEVWPIYSNRHDTHLKFDEGTQTWRDDLPPAPQPKRGSEEWFAKMTAAPKPAPTYTADELSALLIETLEDGPGKIFGGHGFLYKYDLRRDLHVLANRLESLDLALAKKIRKFLVANRALTEKDFREAAELFCLKLKYPDERALIKLKKYRNEFVNLIHKLGFNWNHDLDSIKDLLETLRCAKTKIEDHLNHIPDKFQNIFTDELVNINALIKKLKELKTFAKNNAAEIVENTEELDNIETQKRRAKNRLAVLGWFDVHDTYADEENYLYREMGNLDDLIEPLQIEINTLRENNALAARELNDALATLGRAHDNATVQFNDAFNFTLENPEVELQSARTSVKKKRRVHFVSDEIEPAEAVAAEAAVASPVLVPTDIVNSHADEPEEAANPNAAQVFAEIIVRQIKRQRNRALAFENQQAMFHAPQLDIKKIYEDILTRLEQGLDAITAEFEQTRVVNLNQIEEVANSATNDLMELLHKIPEEKTVPQRIVKDTLAKIKSLMDGSEALKPEELLEKFYTLFRNNNVRKEEEPRKPPVSPSRK
ncbi:MAG TPA: hypothetical protein VGV92_09145 [Gammaproteobacteria bacterium]|nr:hypothetical protein [Gammaproteobacteria bacterium]